MNPVTIALRRRRDGLSKPEQSANADDSWAEPYLQPASEAPAEAVRAGWDAVRIGQEVPMIGEEVGYVEPGYYR